MNSEPKSQDDWEEVCKQSRKDRDEANEHRWQAISDAKYANIDLFMGRIQRQKDDNKDIDNVRAAEQAQEDAVKRSKEMQKKRIENIQKATEAYLKERRFLSLEQAKRVAETHVQKLMNL